MDLRRATPEDAAAIVALWRRSGASPSVTDDVEYIRRTTRHASAIFVLACSNDEVVGSLLGTFDGWRGNLYRLVVDPRYRRRGIGRRLVRAVEDVFRTLDVRRINALVEVDRPEAMQFWTAVGYPRDEHVVRHVAALGREEVAGACPP
jgi:ribosomal protein S18 acetylase RimI-like enzyme